MKMFANPTFKKFEHDILLTVLLTVLGTALLGLPAMAKEAQSLSRTLTLSGTAHIKVKPDNVMINTGIMTIAPTAQKALQQNSGSMNRIVSELKASGVQAEDIQTINFSVGPHYTRERYQNGSRNKITGFKVNNSVRIRVKDISRLGDVLDRVVSLGANQINSIQFSVTQTDDMKDKLRIAAMAKAKHKAEIYAQNMGVSLGRVISISENMTSSMPRPRMFRTMGMAAMSADSVPVSAGKNNLSFTVHVVWEIK